jgi:brefeldin A-inhibited guanine nucleotide-exchange protein
MRSKLLSLHLVLTILKSHSDMFVNPSVAIPSSSSAASTQFLQATKQYLCLSLSRNAVSPVIQVFELSVEIFWQVLKAMRAQMKVRHHDSDNTDRFQKEIEVLLNEIFLPILEMRHSTVRQKSMLLSVFIRLCQDPQALVEIYINYDCDRAALENIYERLMNIISKIGQTHFAPPGKDELHQNSKPSAGGVAGPSIPPSLSTSAMNVEGSGSKSLYAGLSPEIKLRRQSLECLVEALKSLVIWSSAGRNAPDENAARASEDGPARPYSAAQSAAAGSSVALAGDGSELLVPSRSGSTSAQGTGGAVTPEPRAEDDVDRFESAKQRKTNLLEGVKKFNFKPKRVS